MTADLAEGAKALINLVSSARKIVTVAHTHPDGDAVGSSIGMAAWLESLGKEVCCLFPDTLPAMLDFLLKPERMSKCLVYSNSKTLADDKISSADLILVLDLNSLSRTGAMENTLLAAKAPKFLVDHHLNPDTAQFAGVVSCQDISSASELAYYLIKETGMGNIGPECAQALMTGMTTDTNNFANSTWPSTLQMASELLERGVDRNAIVANLYQRYGENRLRALGMLLDSRMKITPEGAAIMVLFKEDMVRFALEEGDTEGFVNVPLAIGKVRMSALFKEESDHFRVSLRSKKGTSAATCSNRYFHGGGHENAAGGKIYLPGDVPSPADVPAYVEQKLKEFLS